jgi:hypothetical protein
LGADDAREGRQSTLDQPDAGGTAQAFDQHHDFAARWAEFAHHMAGELQVRPRGRIGGALDAIGYPWCRSGAQAVIVGKTEVVYPLGRRSTPVAADRACNASDDGLWCVEIRIRLAATPAAGCRSSHFAGIVRIGTPLVGSG